MRYCGREFFQEELRWIDQLIGSSPGITRREVSQRFCEQVGWLKPDGGLKEMSCRVALLRLERDGRIRLPAPRRPHFPPRARVPRTLLGEPGTPLSKPAGDFALELKPVEKGDSALWNELIDRYHYLRYTPLPGAQIRYFVESQYGRVAVLGFSAAAWATAPRDAYIGWDGATRKRNLKLVVNNSRFLLLPWVRSHCLATRILALSARRLPEDWQSRYGYRPALLETFVEKDRFEGTCYKAAGWICVGQTRGRGKLDVHHRNRVPVKSIWLYPLETRFQKRLFGAGQ